MNKLVVVVMGQDCKDFAELCLNSVKDADAIVFCDGGSKDEMLCWLIDKDFMNPKYKETIETEGPHHKWLIEQEFRQDDPEMNGKQRNFYLEFLKKHYAGWWALCLDADEVVDNLAAIKEWINAITSTEQLHDPKRCLISIRMRHLFHNLRWEDATQAEHFVPHRLFYVNDDLYYPLGEHQPLSTRDMASQSVHCRATTIWHLAYAPLFHVRNRYRKNLSHSAVHNKTFLDQWYRAHLFDKYPITEVKPEDLPGHLLQGLDINPDEVYFLDRKIEVKHFIDAGHWRDHFKLEKNDVVLEWGSGLGCRVAALLTVGIACQGIELSQYACDNSFTPNNVMQGDITAPHQGLKAYKLVIAYDVLEHVPYEKLDLAITNLTAFSKQYVLVSVPTLGDPNLENDKTHIIKETKEWWKKQFFDRGCKELPVPEHFLYREQLMIFEVT